MAGTDDGDRPREGANPDPTTARGASAREGRATRVAIGVAGTGMTLIVGFVGSWPWCIARILLVGAIGSRAMAATRGGSRRASAVASVAVGLVALPVGATFASSYLTTTGVSPRSIGGVLAAAGGLFALLSGVVASIRALHRWRRVLVVPGVLVLAYGVGLPLVMSVYATNVPRPGLGRTTPSDRGFEYRDVTFTTTDGVRLSGWYIPSGNGAAIALLHGASSTRSNVLEQAVVLARHGYGVLLFDARGHGLSGGRAMEFGWYGDRDVGAAMTFLQHQPDVDPRRIGAVGMSMGGEEAIGAMAGDARIRAVAAEGATNRVGGDWHWLGDRYGLRGTIQQGVQHLTYGIAEFLTAATPPITLRAAVRAAAPRPVFLIAAGNVADEATADRAIRAASPSTVTLWVVPGAGHIGGLRAHPTEWERRVTGFLDRALAGGAAS
jgi:fermentation-respiration switch protein FrsA (DUF1100 family)